MTATALNERKKQPGPLARPKETGSIVPTSRAEMDAAVAALNAHKDEWVAIDLDDRIAILEQILRDLHTIEDKWVASIIEAKGTQGSAFAESEEWATLAYMVRAVRLLRQSLRDIQQHGRPQIPGPVDTLPNGQVRAQIFPTDRCDSLVFSGMTAELWMQPGLTIDDVLNGQASFYRGGAGEGKVVLVLSAGNSGFGIPNDFMYKLFVEGAVVILKMNPVNAYLGPLLARAYRALIERGYMNIVYGGAAEGSYLCYHEGVDSLHLTGSDKTYEAIVFGPGEEGARRKEQREPLLEKPFSCELGCISPVIVVPGPWSQEDINKSAEKVASWLVINAGFNCVTPRVIIQSATWEHRQDLIEGIGQVLASVETRKAYYPGAAQIHENFLAAHPEARQYGESGDGRLPWTFISDVDASNMDDLCFQKEAYCSLFAETSLEADDIPAFLAAAVNFANDHLWGNLTATLIVHPKSLQDPATAAAVEQAVADLRYGIVLINQFAGLGIFAMTNSWGAFPGNDRYDIQSGMGTISNVLMFSHPQKTVIRNPFSISPDPMALNSKTVLEVCRKLVPLQYDPSLLKMPSIVWSAIRC